jgi:hypothetical protein
LRRVYKKIKKEVIKDIFTTREQPENKKRTKGEQSENNPRTKREQTDHKMKNNP